ncbi:hypothetical protein HK101_005441 [Irineochytrium annulatum]|nr:hypothetical protein HK101_005441 [Irineochytrium annulatum]
MDLNNHPVLTLLYNQATSRLETRRPSAQAATWSFQRYLKECVSQFDEAFNSVIVGIKGCHPDRARYLFIGKVFDLGTPRPIGGKRQPGFLSFEELGAGHAVKWILDHACKPPTRRGKKRPPEPGELLLLIVRHLNDALTLLRHADAAGALKDAIDDGVLRGLVRSKHLKLTTGVRFYLPAELRCGWTGRGASVDSEGSSTRVKVEREDGRGSMGRRSVESGEGRRGIDLGHDGRRTGFELAYARDSIRGHHAAIDLAQGHNPRSALEVARAAERTPSSDSSLPIYVIPYPSSTLVAPTAGAGASLHPGKFVDTHRHQQQPQQQVRFKIMQPRGPAGQSRVVDAPTQLSRGSMPPNEMLTTTPYHHAAALKDAHTMQFMHGHVYAQGLMNGQGQMGRHHPYARGALFGP